MRTTILTILLLLITSTTYSAVTRQTYTNRSGSVVGRSYTNGPVTTYKDPRGNTLGFSRETTMGGKSATKVLGSDGTYKGFIMNGMIRDSKGVPQGQIKNTTPYTTKGTTNGKK